MNKKFLAIIITLFAVFGLLFASGFLVFSKSLEAKEGEPVILSVSVEPQKVVPGDIMVVTAEVEDAHGIKSVTADMGGIETIELELVEGDIYQGTWQNKWQVHSTEQKEYITTVTATNILNQTAIKEIKWSDPPDILFSENWDDGNDTGWTDASTKYEPSTTYSHSASYSERYKAAGTDVLLSKDTPIDLTGYTNGSVSWWAYITTGVDLNEYCCLDLYNGASWVNGTTGTNDCADGNDDSEGTWIQLSRTLNETFYNSGFNIRFRCKSSLSGEDVYIDDIQVSAEVACTANGGSCSVNENCCSGNCQNNVCCAAGQTCCSSDTHCPTDSNINNCQYADNYCDTTTDHYCKSSTVTCGANQATREGASCSAVSTSNYCTTDYYCPGSCDRNIRYYGCAGSGSTCEGTVRIDNHYDYGSSGQVCSGGGWVAGSGSVYCGSSEYNACTGSGSPYQCERQGNRLYCNGGGTCNVTGATYTTPVSAGYVCFNGAEQAADTTYYCGFSDWNQCSTGLCQRGRDYQACDGSGSCGYGDYGDDWTNCGAGTACSGGTCAAANVCNPTWAFGSCTGDNCYNDGGTSYYCQGSCDGSNNCDYAANCGTACAEHNVSGWAWSENIGWISFSCKNQDNPTDYGVDIEEDGTFSGYAWSENIGWITFNENELSGCPEEDCKAQVNLDNSEVSGWARALAYGDGWDGWIKMRGTNYGVSINFTTDEFSGFAWSDMVIGWISFNCENCEGDACDSYPTCGDPGHPDYKVMTSFSLGPSITDLTNSFTPCVQSRIPTFSWWVDDTQEPEEPYYYEIQLCGNPDCSGPEDPLVFYSTEDPTYSTSWVPPSPPCLYCCDEEPYNNIEFGGTTYYGQVRASYTGDEWSGSSDSSFITYDHCWPYADFLCDGQDCEEMEIYEEVVVALTNNSTTYDGLLSCFWTLPDEAELVEGYSTSDCEIEVKFSAPPAGTGRERNIELTVTDSTDPIPYSCSEKKTVNIHYPLPEYKEVPPIIWLKNLFARIASVFAGF